MLNKYDILEVMSRDKDSLERMEAEIDTLIATAGLQGLKSCDWYSDQWESASVEMIANAQKIVNKYSNDGFFKVDMRHMITYDQDTVKTVRIILHFDWSDDA